MLFDFDSGDADVDINISTYTSELQVSMSPGRANFKCQVFLAVLGFEIGENLKDPSKLFTERYFLFYTLSCFCF